MQKTEEKKEIKTSASLIEEMFRAGAHFGYGKTRRHPSFKTIIFGSKKGVDILNLEKTSSYLVQALEFVTESAKAGKVFLLIGTKHEARKVVEEAAKTLSLPVVSYRWVGGTLTNFPEIKKRVQRLLSLRGQKESGELDVYTKKERLLLDREIGKLERDFGGIVYMEKIPDALFVVDSSYEKTAVREASRLSIPIVALANSDCDITGVQYPIPANDSSISSIIFFVDKFVKAYQEGKTQRVTPTLEGAEKPETSE